jgi:hypothetical protein
MTYDEFISLVIKPDMVASTHVNELKEIVDKYPFFAQARILYAKALQQSNSILFEANLKFASVYVSDRQWLYYYIHPDKKIVVEPYRRERNLKSAGDYFDMLNIVESEGGDSKQSLKNLAERLKSARALVGSSSSKSITKQHTLIIPKQDKIENGITGAIKIASELPMTSKMNDVSEDNAKKLISERKYRQAIEILRELNLNNPKKSVYFADQIRFLEKIIANSKK